MIALLERGVMYPPIDICVVARAVYDAVSATDAREPAESSQKLHLLSVKDRMLHGIMRRLYWVAARDLLADGLNKGGADRTLLARVCNECGFGTPREVLAHAKSSGRHRAPYRSGKFRAPYSSEQAVGSATKPSKDGPPDGEGQ